MEPLPAELQDRVGIEPVEGAKGDHLIVALSADRPCIRPAGQRSLEPPAVEFHGDLGRLAGALETALLRSCQDRRSGGGDLVEEGRQFAGGLDLDLLPAPDLGHGRPGLGLLKERGDGLQSAADRVQPLGERSMVPGEQQEQAVADRVEGERATLPETKPVRIEDGPPDVVDLQVAFEGRLGGQAGRIERLHLGEMGALSREFREDGIAAAVTEQVVVAVQSDGGREDRMVADEPLEACLDEVVEGVVERPRTGGRRRTRQCRGWARFDHGQGSSGAALCGTGHRVWVGLVSVRAARVAAMVVSMSAAVTP